MALLDQELHEAAPWHQVEDIPAVDERGDEQDRLTTARPPSEAQEPPLVLRVDDLVWRAANRWRAAPDDGRDVAHRSHRRGSRLLQRAQRAHR